MNQFYMSKYGKYDLVLVCLYVDDTWANLTLLYMISQSSMMIFFLNDGFEIFALFS